MKTQMQIVQEAIARLEEMSPKEFGESLVAAGAIETEGHHLFSLEMKVPSNLERHGAVASIFSSRLVVNNSQHELSLTF
ncbi:hypothetical protein [Pantoea ananatis]|uniref:hypothetical protein n=1 Tax=Pantoea ananas TaxID=553 RepID=UPI0003B1855E|nr:hypothetical protein [Pantoea ananatis]ERM12565.1 hypothetical protein L585_20125 [Pantoea ananatis BRT175]